MVTVVYLDEDLNEAFAWFPTYDLIPSDMRWKRLIQDHNVEPGVRNECPFNMSVPEHEAVCRTIERWHPAAPRHDKMGRAIFSNRHEWNEFLAKDPRYVRDASCGDESHAKDAAEAAEARRKARRDKLENETTDETVRRIGEKKVRRMKQKYDRLKAKHGAG